MPGVVISTAVRVGPTTANTTPTATAFFVGVAERGPNGTAHLISSFADYESIYGGFIASGYLHQSVKTYFEEGGARCYISRAVADGATKATLALLDAEATPGTSITLTASGAGDWAETQLKGQVVASGNLRRVQILLNDVVVFRTAFHATRTAIVEEINNSTTAALYVTATNGSSTELPAVVGATLFTNGSDGTTIDGDNVVSALSAFLPDYGPGCVAAPGFTDASTYTGLIAHASANNRIALMGFGESDTVSAAVTTAATYVGEDGGEEYAAFFYPWVKIPSTGSLTETIPCEGFVAAKRAQVQNTYGAWYPYAGEQAKAKYVVGIENPISKTNVETLAAGYINPLRVVNGSLRVYGARSISTDSMNYKFLNSRETLNLIVNQAETALEDFLFRPIDGRGAIFAEIAAALTGIMERIRAAGGLYELIGTDGTPIDNGYSIIVNESINPLTQLAEGTIKAKIGARVSSIGEVIELEITKSTLTATLV